MRNTVTGVLLAALLAGGGGCQLIAVPFVLFGKEPTKDVPAEYPYLADKKACVVVWADRHTLMEYPFVRLELAEHVADAIEELVSGVSFAPNRYVIEMQDREKDWQRTDPALLGARFGVKRVIMIELTQYTTREPASTYLYRGRIGANVKVYNADYPDSAPVYRTAIETRYPPESHGEWGTDEREIRKATMDAFAQELAGRFYDRKVKVQ